MYFFIHNFILAKWGGVCQYSWRWGVFYYA